MLAQVSVAVLVCALNAHQGASLPAPQYQYTYQVPGSSAYKYDINNPQPFNYKYQGNNLNYKYQYNGNNLNYNYQYNGNSNNIASYNNYQYNTPNTYANNNNIRTDVPADQLVAGALAQTQQQGGKILEILGKLNSNPLIARALTSGAGPCSTSPADIERSVKDLLNSLSNYGPEMANVVADIQQMKAYENNPSAVLRSAGQAVADVEPLIPVFTSLFAMNPNCPATRRFARQADDSVFNVCSDSSEFTRNVFLGVGELLTVLRDISMEFNEQPANARDMAMIDNTAAVINDGAEILSDLELAPLARAATFSKECPASLTDVSRSLNQLADVMDAVGGNNLQRSYY